MKTIGKYIGKALAIFFCTTILYVVLLRFIPVYFTPLMFIRSFQNATEGKSMIWNHDWVSLDEISPHLPVAVMASEDQRFLLHYGLDFKAIMNAAEHNRKHKGRKLGASTISQQTAKNVFLWPGRTWLRKGLEMYFTILIETLWGKQRIMEVYLNSIEMGQNIYGVEAVAQYHFNTTANNLSRAQCALIAATLPNPRKFNSAAPTPYLRKRQRQIEQQMKWIPSFPKDGEEINPATVSGGVYKKRR